MTNGANRVVVALTDYAAQGVSRIKNAVDLKNCGTYRGFYVALSHSVTSDGLIIVSDFSENAWKIQGGINRWTRQEYRELELLSKITRLRHEGKLAKSIDGHRRNDLIRQYQAWAGLAIAPKNIHKSIIWNADAPMKKLEAVVDDTWVILPTDTQEKIAAKVSAKKAFVERVYLPAAGSMPLSKRVADNAVDNRPSKRLKGTDNSMSAWPVRFKQDTINFSCAYDAMFVILQGIWTEHEYMWKPLFRKLNNYMMKFSDNLHSYKAGRCRA